MNLGYLTADDTFGTSHHTYSAGGVGTESHILPVQTPPQIQIGRPQARRLRRTIKQVLI